MTVPQPLVSDVGEDALCFNGEIFQGDIIDVIDRKNDAIALFESLNECDCPDDIHHLFETRIYGPYAFAYWNNKMRTLFFGRDPVGRRSLVVHWPDSSDRRLLVSSTANESTRMQDHGASFWHEVEAGLIHQYRFGSCRSSGCVVESAVHM